MKKKLFLVLILACVTVAAIVPTFATAAINNFEIYPNPHVVNYGGTTCTFPDKVSLALSDGLDDVTVNRAYEALSQIDVLVTNGGSEKYAFYVGIYGSGDSTDVYAKQNSVTPSTAGLFDKTDAYMISVGKRATVVLGKDTDAAFYALTTLKMIFSQVTDRKMQLLTVEDWADSMYRGFIEGYYGIPWTTDERVELMRFGGEFKTNIYIYAPKNDPYHSTNWRSLYTDADLQEIKEQVEAGRQSKTRFVWAAHPFNHSAILPGTQYQSGIDALIAKFEQLYSVGVRQFVVSADDVDGDTVGAANRWNTELARDILNDVAAWCKHKGDCFNTIFVPNVYFTISNQDNSAHPESKPENYLTGLVDGLDETVDIMWTGHRVCSSVANGDFDKFTEWTGRKAFMWLNWPVNDYADGRLIMSKGEVFNLQLKNNASAPFIGIVTNPMQYAEADKLSIFATADYSWNINGFDVDKSYQDSFKYVEPQATNEFYEICKHLANASKFEDKYFEESTELQTYIDKIIEDYNAENSLAKSAAELCKQFADITEACQDYLQNAANAKLLVNVQPYVQALIYKTQACYTYTQVLANIDTWSKEEIKSAIALADDTLLKCNECTTPVLNKISYDHNPMPVDVGIAVINVYLQQLEQIYGEVVNPVIGLPTASYEGFDSIYQGSVNNAIDGSDDTFVWFGSAPDTGSKFVVRLGEETLINNIRILTGKLDGNDVWNDCIVEYSLDGVNYTQIDIVSGALNVLDLSQNPVRAKYIRLRGNSASAFWAAIREISVNVN